ncbi:MBL fold metallo-hydrolase [Actinomadura hibisca]|uniref:MBL fold metallo-hydrolase n=1 Tax=Actinomadura hibisca TaxID=68565 RepID=UPI0008378D8B|nr:MBL fold metallo-hydrolase [Actinomadura hibisca]
MNITWWGHSTATIEDRGVRLLTDPVLTGRLGHLRRRRGPAPGGAALRADAVLISHLHADHLHVPSLRRLPETTVLLAPRGARAFLEAVAPELAPRCVELAAGEQVPMGGLTVRAVPAAHDGGRTPWSKHHADTVGYVVSGDRTVWFAGDTDLFDGMAGLGALDVALVPVGGWGPSLGPGHLDPRRAAEAVRRAAPAVAVPIHYGTLWPVGLERVRPGLFLGPEDDFVRYAAESAPGTEVRVLAPGEAITLD